MRLTADPFTLLFAEAVRAPRVGMIVPRIMLAQQVLAVVVAVRSAHDRVDMIARGFVVRIDDSWLVVEFDEHDWTVDAVVEGAVVVVRANPGKVRVAQVIEDHSPLQWVALPEWPDYQAQLPGGLVGGRSIWPAPLPVPPELAARIQPTPEVPSIAVPEGGRDRKSTRLNSTHSELPRMPSSA